MKGFVIQLLIKRCLFLMCLYHLEKYVESDVYFRKIDGISVTDLLSIKDLCFLREKVHVLTLVNVTLSIPLLPQDKNSNSNQNCAISLETSEATKGECKFSINPLHDFFFLSSVYLNEAGFNFVRKCIQAVETRGKHCLPSIGTIVWSLT